MSIQHAVRWTLLIKGRIIIIIIIFNTDASGLFRNTIFLRHLLRTCSSDHKQSMPFWSGRLRAGIISKDICNQIPIKGQLNEALECQWLQWRLEDLAYTERWTIKHSQSSPLKPALCPAYFKVTFASHHSSMTTHPLTADSALCYIPKTMDVAIQNGQLYTTV